MNRFLIIMASLGLGAVMLRAAEPARKPDLTKLPPAARGTMDFQRDIQPIFARACLSCHGTKKHRGGLRLDDGDAAFKGSNSGPVIKPGDGAHSRLLEVVAGLDEEIKMPPSGTELTAEEVGKLRAWIDQGAKWPKGSQAAGAATSEKSDHWAFIPPPRPPLPRVARPSWVRNEIDAFVLARLEAEKLEPSPEADRVTLIRRLSLDLLGLPPTPEEVDQFLKDTEPDAYERLVDRVLASPHYGERWGRSWLDLARYADSDGYEKDNGRPFAWRYRSWVIEALNRDLPFDQFAVEQLAGDLLPNATLEQKIATGFHRNTLTNTEGGVDQEQFRVEAVIDRVNTTAKVFMGVTLGCAQCHDHKYDPFSQREYYQFFAFFNSDAEVNIPAPLSPDEIDTYNRNKAEFDKKLSELKVAQAAFTNDQLPANQLKWEKELKPEELQKLPPEVKAILQVEAARRDEKQKKALADFHARTDKKLVELNKEIAAHQKAAPTLTLAQTLALGSPRKTHVLFRGDFLRPGVEVHAAAPAVLAPRLATVAGGEKEKGQLLTRLDLAKWVVNPRNPLTARVITNWMWHHYFGRGIVPTLEDFGTRGEKPSHAQLLDWLATEFVRQKWGMKAMHKIIVTSATYRQSSRSRPELLARDPLNVLLARQNRSRVEAEVVRDMALAASGLLNLTIGGPSVRPPQPAGISELTYAGSARWLESKGPARYRRGLYTWFQRTSPYPMLMTFDAPDSNVCCVRRERSNTPLQALTLLNDPVFFECAQALGGRIMKADLAGPQERIRHAFRLCLAREPSAAELSRLHQLFEELLQLTRSRPDAAKTMVGPALPAGYDLAEAGAWVALARTILNLDEFVTKE